MCYFYTKTKYRDNFYTREFTVKTNGTQKT